MTARLFEGKVMNNVVWEITDNGDGTLRVMFSATLVPLEGRSESPILPGDSLPWPGNLSDREKRLILDAELEEICRERTLSLLRE